METGYVRGGTRAPAYITVYAERPDGTRGPLKWGEERLERDQRSPRIDTETGRIIYTYRYTLQDPLSDDVHAWCQGGDETIVP
jgi:hypothetical protein